MRTTPSKTRLKTASAISLLSYLDRNIPLIRGKLGNAPPGYVIIPGQVWARDRGQALDLTPVLTVHAGGDEFLLLRHGPAIAALSSQ